MSTSLQQGVAALDAGDKALARRLFGRAIQEDPQSEQAWLWLSGAVESDKERLMCLNKVLAINPDNEMAQRGAAALQQRQTGRPSRMNSSCCLCPQPPSRQPHIRHLVCENLKHWIILDRWRISRPRSERRWKVLFHSSPTRYCRARIQGNWSSD